jgi:phage/plasmid-like protein (TIGR03299 family)
MTHAVETMAYTGEVPWHGLGTEVNNTMSPKEMLKAAQIDWTVSKRPAYTTDRPDVWNLNDPTEEAGFLRASDQYFLVRDSDNKILSPCGESYVPFQNAEVMDFFKKFTEAGSMTMETAGSLKEGKDIWGLAKITDKFSLSGGDEVGGYLLLNNSHQVGKAMTVMFTSIRVVCNNTLTMALKGHYTEGNRFRVLHLQMFDEEIHKAAEEALGISGQQMQQFKEQSEFLESKRAKEFDLSNYIAELFQPNLLIERAKAADQAALPPLYQEFARTAELVHEAVECSPGANLASAKGTWWGALNAVTYVVDHQKKSMAEGNALHSAWFGSGANTKRKALAKALEYAES